MEKNVISNIVYIAFQLKTKYKISDCVNMNIYKLIWGFLDFCFAPK